MAGFSIYPRKKKNGKPVYYAQFKKSDGTYNTAKSTGCSTRRDANAWCEDYLKKHGSPLPGQNLTLSEYAKNFFDFNGAWATDKKVRGQRISRSHCLDRTDEFNKHVAPVFGNMPLSEINKVKLRDFRNALYQQGYSGSLINKCLYAIKAVLEAAEDAGYINAVPKIEKAADRPKEKGILTIEEVSSLFRLSWESVPSYSHPSKPQYIGYVGNLLAASTGLRLGELQGLTIEDLHLSGGYIVVRRSWERRSKTLTETTKNGRVRNIFIPQNVVCELQNLVEVNPYKRADSFLFFSTIENQPIDSKVFVKSLFVALKKIGIDEFERKRRNITFHSWRHFFNSLLLNAKIPIQKVQSLTGHLTTEMSQHYYHIDDMKDVRKVQDELFSFNRQLSSASLN